MNPFDRKQSSSWPNPFGWSKLAVVVMLFAFAGGAVFQFQKRWSSLERYYIPAYIETWALPYKSAKSYQGIFLLARHSKLLATDADIELERQADGSWRAVIAVAAKKTGWKQWSILTADTNEIKSGPQLHRFLQERIYRAQSGWDLACFPAYWALADGTLWLIPSPGLSRLSVVFLRRVNHVRLS